MDLMNRILKHDHFAISWKTFQAPKLRIAILRHQCCPTGNFTAGRLGFNTVNMFTAWRCV